MMKIGSSSGVLPWPGTCTSGITGYPIISELFLNDIFPGLQLELPLSARSTEFVRTMAPPPPTGVARKALQALEGLKLAEKDPNGGRRLTSQGRWDLDRTAAQFKVKKAEAIAAQAAAVIATA